MPGGLTAWLKDDDGAKRKENGTNAKEHKRPRSAIRNTPTSPRSPTLQPLAAKFVHNSSSADFPVIDVDAAIPSLVAGPGSPPFGSAASPTKAAWDPFASEKCDAHNDAFARLLRGSSTSKPGAVRTEDAPPFTPSQPEPNFLWDPFASADDGKENRGNAFSKLLSASSHGSAGKGRSVHIKGASSATGKRKRPAGSSPRGPAAGAKAEAATRFCLCPVCGKRVIIDLCSKHLDTECTGADAVSGATYPTSPPHDSSSLGLEVSSTASESTTASASSDHPSPHRQPDTVPPTPRMERAERNPEIGRVTPTSAVRAGAASDRLGGADTLAGGPDRRAPSEAQSAGTTSGTCASAAASSCLAPPSAAAGAKPVASRRRSSRGTVEGSSPSGSPGAVTTCPICGQQVLVDLCSLHLDTDCAGPSPSPPRSGDSSGGVSGKGEAAEKEGDGASPRKGGREQSGSEAAGGLTALAAELTCPVCLCVFEDAHTLPCSHRFCLECITGCFRSSKRQECPLCKVPAWKRDLKRDVPLQNIILAYRRMTA